METTPGTEGRLAITPIVVLGMYRSGTSSIAGALEKLGVYFGKHQDFFPVDEFNKTGYRELREIMEFNRAVLAAFGMNSIHARPLQPNWQDLPGNAWITPQLGRILEKHFSGHPVWGWKEPQTCPLMPVYRKALEDIGLSPHYVICVRNPLDTLASQRDLGPLPLIGPRALGLWLHYTLSSLHQSIGTKRTVVIYESLLENPRLSLSPIISEITNIHPSESDWEKAEETIQPKLCHSRSTLKALDDYPELLKRVYELCREAEQSPSDFRAGQFDSRIEQLWKHWLMLSEMTETEDLPYGIVTVSWQQGASLQQAKVPYAPKGRWQTLKTTVEAPPNSPLRLHLYHLPCQVWIRKSLWRCGKLEGKLEIGPGPNGVVEEVEGVLKLGIFGPDHLRGMSPTEAGPVEIELEILLQSNQTVTVGLVSLLRSRLDQLRQGRKP